MPLLKDSPLRNLPADLPEKQALYLDGIRYCLGISHLAWKRLEGSLVALGADDVKGDALVTLVTAVVADAWQIIDVVNRLRDLLREMPGLKKGKGASPLLHVFQQRTEAADKLRNVIQHIESNIPAMATKLQPVWGMVSWSAQSIPNEGRLCAVVAGRLADGGIYPMVTRPSGKAHIPVDVVTLTCAGISIDLGKAIDAVDEVVGSLQESLKGSFAGKATAAADVVLQFDWKATAPDNSDGP